MAAVTNITTPVVVIPATASASAAPSGSTDPIKSGKYRRLRTFLAYAGTVNSATVRIWFKDPGTTTWYAGADTDDLDALAPGGAAPVNEVRDWEVGQGAEVWFQLSAIAGGGTAAVRVQGVAV